MSSDPRHPWLRPPLSWYVVVLLLVAAVLLVFSWMGVWGAIRIQAAQIHSHLYGVLLIGLLGSIGGGLSASREGTLASYVSPEQLKETETKLKEGLSSQRQRDHRALKLFDDQADLTTSAPDETALREAIMAAGATIHERIYVRARETFNLAIERAAMYRELADIKRQLGGQESPSEKEHALLRRIAARLRPVMRALVDLDPERRYSGSRFGLGLAYYYLGDLPAAKAMVDEAIEIAKARKRDPVVRAETIERYEKTLYDIAAAQGEQL